MYEWGKFINYIISVLELRSLFNKEEKIVLSNTLFQRFFFLRLCPIII